MLVRENQSNTRDVFITLCSEDFVLSCLERYTEISHVQVVRYIVLRNILSGRVIRQWLHHPSECTACWLADYVRQVSVYYQTEHSRWLYLQDKAGQLELYDLLINYAYDYICGLGWQAGETDALEIAHEAFVTSPERLRRYPFDLALGKWLDRHARQSAQRLFRSRQTMLLSDDAVDRLMDHSLDSDSLLWDAWIDLIHEADQLSTANQEVLRMWYMGFTLNETSHWLHLSEKAVSNRRGRIQKRLSTP
jgi:DNA-directed RNA polymerase specialized sigma24 family protein